MKDIASALITIQQDLAKCKDARELKQTYQSYQEILEQLYYKRLSEMKDKDYYADCYMQVVKETYELFVDKIVKQTDSGYAEHCLNYIEDISTYREWRKSFYVQSLKEMMNRYGYATDYEAVMSLHISRMRNFSNNKDILNNVQDNVIGYWVTKDYDNMWQAYQNALGCIDNANIINVLKTLAEVEKEKKEYLPFCIDEEPPVVPVKKQFDKNDYASMYIDSIKMGYADIVNQTSLWGEAKNITDEDHSRLVRLWDKIKDISDYEDWIASEDVKQFHDITYGKYNLEDCELAMNYVDEVNVGYWCYYYYDNLPVAIEQINDKIYPSHKNMKEFQEVKEIIANLILDEKDLETEVEKERSDCPER